MTEQERLEVTRNLSVMLARRAFFLEGEISEAKRRIDEAMADNNEAALPQLWATHRQFVTAWIDACKMIAPETNMSH